MYKYFVSYEYKGYEPEDQWTKWRQIIDIGYKLDCDHAIGITEDDLAEKGLHDLVLITNITLLESEPK